MSGPAVLQPAGPPVVAAAAPGIDATVYGSVAQASPPPAPSESDTDGGLFWDAGAAPPSAAPHYSRAPVAQEASTPLSYAPALPNRPYTLDSGDRLRVVVFGQDGLSNSYVVDVSGYIDMPLIGPVLARGATTNELRGRIAAKLRQGYVNDPHVAVEVEAYRPFFILGEVAQPGQYPYVADMTVETAVAIAGGFGPRAYRGKVKVTRVVHGQQISMTVPTSFALRPGDTVNVQERWF
ncbi:MAG: polysaccharide biosynthesis/export family protein [Xanthobacteraceae bacterium]